MPGFVQPLLFFGVRHFDFDEFINQPARGIAKAKGVTAYKVS